MPLRNKTPVVHSLEGALQVRDANVDSTASATAVIIVVSARGLGCALQLRRRCAVRSTTCQRALILQRDCAGPTAEALFVRQARHHATPSLCTHRPTASRNGEVGHHSHHGEEFRAQDVVTGQRYHPTVDGKIKGREVRRGRMAKERRHIKHFAQRAPRHDNVRVSTSSWNINTSCTLRASAP
jgi:hypothetical protein